MNSVSSSGIYHFKSPQNSFLVKFIELEHYKSTGSTDMDDISNVKYTIYFYKNADSLIAQTDYADVYGWRKGDLPTEPKVIFKALTWSPREDFVILPEEGWASAPGPPNLKVVNLNTQYSWNETRIYMDISHWVDVYRIIGDSYNDCYFTAAMFDGKIGKMSEIIKSKSPIGYKIEWYIGSRKFA